MAGHWHALVDVNIGKGQHRRALIERHVLERCFTEHAGDGDGGGRGTGEVELDDAARDVGKSVEEGGGNDENGGGGQRGREKG